TITATGNDPKAEVTLTADKAGEFQLDVVSLFPPTFKGRENGMRPDLAQMLADMNPTFMRFPGGCFVEGQISPDNAFRWKRTIGPIEQREGHPNVNWGYRTSDGIGFHEYLQLAEDLGAKPLYVVNVGIWHGGCTPYDQIGEWIQECLDALEYANGDVTTKYGKMRAENGHPEPFNLEFIEIGNENYNFNMEDNSDQSDHYPERYIQFYNAIKEKYPNVKCIGNVESWSTDFPSWRNDYPVEMVDEHYYRNPKWFADNFNKYDTYDRSKNKVYVGEYAVTSNFGEIGNLNAALGEAVYMMGMENNSDVVVMNSYAPIFVNENDARWRPDMIRFNSAEVMGTPSYYVQQLFANNVGTQVVYTDWTY
ncbi:MAG: arabinosidase, partial [Muribaculaceae bacterium]|nr:arabinosidase [Muribaculaceae bacterium]